MNYTEEVKSEVLKQIDADTNRHSFLLACTKMCASMQLFKNNQYNLIYEIKDQDLAFKLYELIKEIYDLPLEMGFTNIEPKIYNITIEGKYATKMLKDMHLAYLDKDGYVFDESVKYINSLKKQEEAQAYIQGVFLSQGSVYFPEGAGGDERGYHLEISFNEKDYCLAIQNLLKRFGITLNFIDRESNFSLYAKAAEVVSDMLAFIRAMNAVLKLSEVNVQREMNSKLNRESNFMAANFDKTLAANVKYINAINLINEKIGIKNLDEKMVLVSQARLEYSQLSMSELAEKVGMTKSSLNRVLAKILEKAEKLKGEE